MRKEITTMEGVNARDIKILRSNRKSIAIEIRTDGILVRAPKYMKKSEIDMFLTEKESWIKKHVMEMEKRKAAMQKIEPFTMEQMQELADRAVKIIPERVKYYAPYVGVDYGRITIRNQRTRWGSCSSKGNLNFNCLLVLFPEEILDSVVVHELCHRKHMNHSKQFYDEVNRVFPDYKRCNQWLKEHGGTYLSRMPR